MGKLPVAHDEKYHEEEAVGRNEVYGPLFHRFVVRLKVREGAIIQVTYYWRNKYLQNDMLPVDVVFAPAWWYKHAGITFDEDFFFHPARRVEDERKMEITLHDRWGQFGLGADYDKDLPIVGATHLAAGYLVPEMLGCRVVFHDNSPPQVLTADVDHLTINVEAAFESPAYKRFVHLVDVLKKRYGTLYGDVNWSGILNTALDLRGQQFFMDMFDKPDKIDLFTKDIATVTERFADNLARETGTTSISVNRNVRNIPRPVFLHSECSLVMISTEQYKRFLMKYDIQWSKTHRPFGIHYCGSDPHRYAEIFARLPHLDFLDVGWSGDITVLRKHLPKTFLNIRLSPAEIIKQKPEQIRRTVRELVKASGNPWLTGVCCINMDDQVQDEQITAIFEEVELLRAEFAGNATGGIIGPHRRKYHSTTKSHTSLQTLP